MKNRQIRTKLEKGDSHHGELSGWLSGKQSYLWFGYNGQCEGTLGGRKLYRLAKAIVSQFEKDTKMEG